MATIATAERIYGQRKTMWRGEIADLVGDIAPSKSEAIANVERAAVDALTGTYAPIVIAHAGYVGIGMRSPFHGWMTFIIEPDGRDRCVTYHGSIAREEAEASLRSTMARYIDGQGIDGMPVLLDDDARDELRRYRAWQAA